MPPGMDVGLSPGDFVFDGDLATPRKKAHPPHPIFGPCLLRLNGWMDEEAIGMEVDLGPGHIERDGVLALRERGTASPIFSAHVYCDHGRPSQLLLSSCRFRSGIFFYD